MRGGAVARVIVVIVVVFINLRQSANTGPVVKLTVWGTEDPQQFAPIAISYPYGTVKYVQVDQANYQSQLLSALAAGTGPDVFEISNRDLPKWKSILAPLPAAYAQTFGPLQLSQEFPDVVAQDFVSGGQIYGLPLSIDTLAMIYNKDIFNSAGIAIPPATWDQFDADITKLRTLDASGNITQAAAAIGGTGASIPNAPDIVSLLMLQNGTAMTDPLFTSAQFGSTAGSGLAAFNFYLQFANAASPYYTWSDSLGNSLASFAAGQTAIIFGYQSDLAAIKAKAPFLNFGIAPVPQPTGATLAINYTRYNGFVVAKASAQPAPAWNLVLYLTTTEAIEKMYVSATGAPPALRTEIQADMNDPALSVFASQALTARSWFEADSTQINSIMNTAITKVQTGAETSDRALNEAQAAVNQLMQQPQ